MQINPTQLRKDLKARRYPVYMVCGDEPLQHREALDMLRKAMHYYGYQERDVYIADGQFNWQSLLAAANELSLFADKKVIEIHLPTGKPSDQGKALIHYCEHLPADTILFIVAAKIEAATKKSKWYKAVDSVAGIINVWPIEGQRLNQWLHTRLQSKGLNVAKDALQLINERVEGNLLAADQEIEKLSLLYPVEKKQAMLVLSYEQVSEAVFDNARYNLFSLFDCALSGDLKRSSRILYGLKREDQSIILILALFAKEVRMLARMSAVFYSGDKPGNIELAMHGFYIFPKRKMLLARALRTEKTVHWQHLLKQLLLVDKTIKGVQSGDPWAMMQLILATIAGQAFITLEKSYYAS